VSSVSNEELSQIYAALVLLKNFADLKFERLLEYLTLRRVHSFTTTELTLILSSYGYLCQQSKANVSSSFIKTFEYVIFNKLHDLTQDQLAQTLVALFKIQRVSAKTTKVVSNQTLLQMLDKFTYELEDLEGKPVKASNLAEVYYHVKRHEILSKEVECAGMEDRLMKHQGQLKARDLFNIMSVMDRDARSELVEWLVKQVEGVIASMIPEEVVILNAQLERHGLQARVSK
jgi:hypothetical protein